MTAILTRPAWTTDLELDLRNWHRRPLNLSTYVLYD
ncbi:hypothetical protein NSTCB13_06951 [Nostoc sp. DSM 114160]|jgi:hypothetical protein